LRKAWKRGSGKGTGDDPQVREEFNCRLQRSTPEDGGPDFKPIMMKAFM
jgi:hypothetical protein